MRGLFPLRDLYSALREKERGPSKRTASGNSPDAAGAATIGGRDCWCGREQGHDWPMKEIGAAHPRYPT